MKMSLAEVRLILENKESELKPYFKGEATL